MCNVVPEDGWHYLVSASNFVSKFGELRAAVLPVRRLASHAGQKDSALSRELSDFIVLYAIPPTVSACRQSP